jgi:hypothetical protein
MPPEGFSCKQCGNCCLNLSDAFSTCADERDVRLWKKLGRSDILEWVACMPVGKGVFIYDLWLHPTTGEDVQRCPWLRELPRKNQYVRGVCAGDSPYSTTAFRSVRK